MICRGVVHDNGQGLFTSPQFELTPLNLTTAYMTMCSTAYRKYHEFSYRPMGFSVVGIGGSANLLYTSQSIRWKIEGVNIFMRELLKFQDAIRFHPIASFQDENFTIDEADITFLIDQLMEYNSNGLRWTLEDANNEEDDE